MTVVNIDNNLGTVQTRYYTLAHKLALENGEALGPITIAYETYGRLNDSKSNAVLILHALSGDAHAAGLNMEGSAGWWDAMIGPGKAFDADRYFIICSNVIGGCQGSTGPSSINPESGRSYGLDFPMITIGDMVQAQRYLLDYLGIDRLLSVAGGSMGGMQVLEWMIAHPEFIRSAIPISTTLRHSPQQIAFNEVGRQAIMADPAWGKGDYYKGAPPANGLAVARMVGHITYMSDKSMAQKFGRRVKEHNPDFKFKTEFEVEGYLNYKGNGFVKRFDANSYLYITKALDYYDATRGKTLADTFKGGKASVLVIAFKSDWLYPCYQTQEIVKACKLAGLDVSYCEIESSYGHDAFLLETDEESLLIKHFLDRVSQGSNVK